MAKTSAGILLYRWRSGALEVFLVHPGGPFWAGKDEGAWSIPKGEYTAAEDALTAARREFYEETGQSAAGPAQPLTPVKQRGGKVISVWAVPGELDPAQLRSNLFRIEWPPKSGVQQEFPEVDRGQWFSLPEARRKLSAGQRAILEEFAARAHA
ncbi:MAG: NUDIX domain-containing protein [Steroidobacterales bacterium]